MDVDLCKSDGGGGRDGRKMSHFIAITLCILPWMNRLSYVNRDGRDNIALAHLKMRKSTFGFSVCVSIWDVARSYWCAKIDWQEQVNMAVYSTVRA